MELSSDGKIKCDNFGEITAVDCVSLMSSNCEDCILYSIHKDLQEETVNV